MSQESFPRNTEGDIVDDSGRSIAEVTKDGVEMHNRLAEQKRTHDLERDALQAAKDAKLQATVDLDKPDAQTGPEVAEYHRQKNELFEDARLLGGSSEISGTRAYHHELAIKEHDQGHAAHVNENLPAYVQTATEMANAQLEPRAGEKVVVTSREEGLVGFTEVTPVDPARSNQDVGPPQTN